VDTAGEELGRFVPGRGTANVVIWRDGVLLQRARVRCGQVLAIGRAPDPEWTHHLVLNQRSEPQISRIHVTVSYDPRTGWRVSHLPTVKNPGRIRHWGDLSWRDADVVDMHPRTGLLAYLFPGAPRYVLTMTSRDPRLVVAADSPGAAGVATVEPAGLARIGMTATQRMVILDALTDAVHWPPDPCDGRILGWAEMAAAGKGLESYRANYRRLEQLAAASTELAWTNGSRGPDPALLRKLIDSAEITYLQVYRQRGGWPRGGLIPTHHTHHSDGRERAR